ncbi:MAG TPA: chorismate synthase [Thermodesulfovibrionales bacterium]|nr:chorismate synthase [Thermodesulfovibrionales bacterium]
MTALRYITAGESHGKGLAGIIEGIPSGLSLHADDIDRDLVRRQGGYGRGGRMKIESDHAEILSGVRWGKTMGSPITLIVENKDYKNWSQGMSSEASAEGAIPAVTRPRPGHADLTGALKYDHRDVRNILERSSARETAMRVALGAVARKFLSVFSVRVGSYIVQIGTRKATDDVQEVKEKELLDLFSRAEGSPVRCPDEKASRSMVKLIDRALREGNSLGGIFEVFVTGLPVGLGSHIQWDRKLDGRLAQALMSIQAIKGVEVGLGFEMGRRFGSEVMDEIFYMPTRPHVVKSGNMRGVYRKTNNAGGIEGGMTNGMPVILRAAMKPIPTLRKPLRSVDLITKEQIAAAYERSDVCAVPAASVIGEAMVALTVADAFLEKFGGDNMSETKRNYDSYMEYVKKF